MEFEPQEQINRRTYSKCTNIREPEFSSDTVDEQILKISQSGQLDIIKINTLIEKWLKKEQTLEGTTNKISLS